VIPVAARWVGGVFGLAFGGIGTTILVSMWTVSGFGEPPLVAKLVASFISLVFIAVGGTMLVSAMRGGTAAGRSAPGAPPAGGGGYACPACGGRLGSDAEVSPKGDVKCGYCRKWFNIHS
jgi:hypothetical protein